MSTQVCPGCMNAVDVTPFAPGARVACGGCGNVLVVAAAAPPPPPAAPVPPPPAPPARRGPARPSRPARSKRPPRAARPARGARRGAARAGRPADNRLLLGSLAAVVVVVALALAFWPGGDEPEPAAPPARRGAKPEEKPEGWRWVLQNFEREYEKRPPETKQDFLAAIDRLQRIGKPADDMLRRVYEAYVAGPGADSVSAHRFLGHAEFTKEVPESIAFREYPYLRAVEAATAKRWFGPGEKDQLDAANRAWAQVEAHAKRLAEDRKFRAIDQVRANVARDPYLRNYRFAVRWADPYLICYSSHHRLSEFELQSITDPDDRRQLREEIEERKKSFERILNEKAVLFTDTYKEFMNRYASRYGLEDLMDEWGGRPDYEVGRRAFKDGCPLVVWIFSDRRAFQEYHSKVKREDISPFIAGYFSPSSGYIFLFDEAKDRLGEINKNVHEAVHQLVHWFTRQRHGWSMPRMGQTFFGEGFAEWFGSVRMGADHKLSFVGVNVPRVRAMQAGKLELEAAKREYPIFPLRQLVAFDSYREVAMWGVKQWKLPPAAVLLLFYEQSWALVHFLHDGAQGARREDLLTFFGHVLEDKVGSQATWFREALGLSSEARWKALDEEFQAFVRKHLMRMDVERYAYDPPPLGGGR